MKKTLVKAIGLILVVFGSIMILFSGNITGNSINEVAEKGLAGLTAFAIFLLLLPILAIILGLAILVFAGIKNPKLSLDNSENL